MKTPFMLFCTLISTFSLAATELDIEQFRNPKTHLLDAARIKAAVNKGFDVSASRSDDGYTLLHAAAEMGNADLVRFLMGKGANAAALTKDGASPLATAIYFSKNDAIRAFVEAGIDTNFVLGERLYKRSHFHYYVTQTRKIDQKLFDLFIAKKANLETIDSFNETPLISASSLDYSMTNNGLMLIKAGANLQAAGRGGKTALMAAAYSRNVPFIKALIKAGAPVEQKEAEGSTALISMVGMGNPEEPAKIAVMRVLLSGGADINAQNAAGRTALHEAIANDFPQMVKFLIDKKANLALRDAKGYAPLEFAVLNERLEIIKVIAKHDKDLNRLDKYGSTMLHSAVMNNKMPIARILVEAGADVNAKDKWGKGTLYQAKHAKNDEMIRYLESKGATD